MEKSKDFTGWSRRKRQYLGRRYYRYFWETLFYEHVSNSESLEDRDPSIYKYKIIVNDNKGREIILCYFYFNFNLMFKGHICYREMTNSLQFTVNVQKSHSQHQFTFCISCMDIACCSSEFRFIYLGRNIQNANAQLVLCIHHPFVNLALHPNLQKKFKGINSGDSKSYISLNICKQTHVGINHSFTMTDSIKGKGKAVPLQAWSGPEGSRKLRFPGHRIVVRFSGLRTVPRAILRSEGFMSM
jgi:hypothetical protein